MTFTLLASVSLFALVVTSRPILSAETGFAPTSSAFQPFVQAPFRIHPGKDDLTSDVARFHFQKHKQQIEYIAELGTEAVAVLTPLELSHGEPPSSNALLDDDVEGQDAIHSSNEALRSSDAPTSSESIVGEQHEVPTDESPFAPLIVLAFSCIAAFLALACVALTLYIIKSLRSQVLASETAWRLLPRFWMRLAKENTGATTKQRLSSRGSLLLQTEGLLDAEEGSPQRHESHLADKPLYFDAVSNIGSEWDDVDEKYQDALDMTPLPLIHDLPLDDNVSHPPPSDDPPLPLPEFSHPLDCLTASDRSTPPMRELCLSPITRPAWSVRATDSPALGLSSCQSGVDATPQPLLIHPRRRAYRSPVPELDIALAMQLRPGLGIGADSAWMVRFLMAIFGWFAVALTGNSR